MPGRLELRGLRARPLAALTALSVASALPGPALALELGEAVASETSGPLAVACNLSDPEMCKAIEIQLDKDVSPLLKAYESGGAELEPGAIEVTLDETSPVDFTVKLVGAQDGATASSSVTCKACTETELVEAITGALADLLPQLSDAAREASATPPPPDPAEPAHTEPDPPAEPVGRRPLGPMGIAGVMGMVVGAAMVGTGVPLGLRDDEVRGASGSSSGTVDGTLERRSTKAAGWALTGIGTGVVVTGAALLVVDRVRKPQERGARIAPMLGPERAGLTIQGRF